MQLTAGWIPNAFQAMCHVTAWNELRSFWFDLPEDVDDEDSGIECVHVAGVVQTEMPAAMEIVEVPLVDETQEEAPLVDETKKEV
eukprot:5266678-Amphidinium_carterae.1